MHLSRHRYLVSPLGHIKSVYNYRVYKKKRNLVTSEFPNKSTLQFLSIKDFRPLGIEIELLIQGE
jgi:hypothetical protein